MTDVHTKQTSAEMPAVDEPLRLAFKEPNRPTARITVVGVGGGGGNAVNRMVEAGPLGVELIVANTDIQALKDNATPNKIQLGAKITKGLGAGADPNLGREAALEDTNTLLEALDGSDVVFVTAGLGGGTGTGAVPVIAGLASQLGALTIAVVTTPFAFEGKQRAKRARQGLEQLRECVDSVITIPNERLVSTTDKSTSLVEAFKKADDVLRQAIQGISDLILVPGLINLDFADVKTIMKGKGMAIMGTGVGEGPSRASTAANLAISSPLLEDASVEGADGVIIMVTGGDDLSMREVNEASSIIHEAAHEDANIIFGAVVDPKMKGRVKVTVIATGLNQNETATAEPDSTPVDLQYYASLKHENDDSAIEVPRLSLATQPAVDFPLTADPTRDVTQRASAHQPRRFGHKRTLGSQQDIARRLSELPEPAAQSMVANGGPADVESSDADTLELNVPTFFRRR
ncbi:MAG: cell division protein FtsZ [Vicinamibacterales bacterium]|nr:cell division protein FtsZ [Vicinamibacterales bacterium]